MYKIKKHLKKLNRISKKHDYLVNPHGIYLNRNERILPFSQTILNQIKQNIDSRSLSLYPDLNNFYKKLSIWLKVNKKEIYLNEGVSGLIKSIFEVYCEENKSNIIIPDPTFAMYEVFSKMYKVKLKKIKYDDSHINIDKIFKIADKKTSLIILPNPNVPIEGFINLEKIKQVLKFCKKNKIMLVMDEVYYPFSKISTIKIFKKYKNHFIILRSFSKAFGLAGIRLGYALSSEKNIDYLSKTRGGYETNNLSVLAASILIDNYYIVETYIKEIEKGLNFFKLELKKLNLKYIGGTFGNYIFVQFNNKNQANIIHKKLSLNKIYVRNGWPKPYDNGLLISGANKNTMTKVSKVLEKNILNE